jgi:signal transduction histidine kinase
MVERGKTNDSEPPLLAVMARTIMRSRIGATLVFVGVSCVLQEQEVAAFCRGVPENLSRQSRSNRCARLLQYPWKDSSAFFKPSQSSNDPPVKRSPIPVMPSLLFQDMALSQLELLASSMPAADGGSGSKIKSMALYLPQENAVTGQLEFLPAVLYPHPQTERVFIANDSDSGVAPSMPTTLTKLPGFAHATSLLPGYPMVSISGSEAGVGVVEEVLCDVKLGGTALSVPLFRGSQTVGVLLVSPVASSDRKRSSMWTEYDRQQVARAAKSLSLALSMDTERTASRIQNQQVQDALSDSLHQFKNPLQALRTYGKLLQRRMADGTEMTPQLLELAEHLMVQSDRLVERLKPVDAIVDGMAGDTQLLALNPVEAKALVPWRKPNSYSWEVALMDFARDNMPSKKTNVEQASPSIMAENGQTVGQSAGSEMEVNDSSLSVSSPPSSLLGEMQLEMAFVTDVLDPIFAAFRAIASDRGISLTVEQEAEELPGVVIWPQALQEAVINLLDNAFKYVLLPNSESQTASQPRVRVRLLPNSRASGVGPGVTLLVEDNGPGIPAQDREAVFERGFRSKAVAQAVDGSGIGLDIARSLTEQMGGTLQAVDKSKYPNSLRGAILELVVFRKSPKRG